MQNKTVHLVVVKNESVLAKDRSFALYATSAHLKLKEANGLTNSDELAQWTQATVIFADGRANQTPSLDAATFRHSASETRRISQNGASQLSIYRSW